ncbi:MAG: hypothetical protein ACI4JW_06415 [Oscillospiraceae bacterium]
MKLNHRDKLLLIGVFVVLIWVAGIMLFIKPALDDMKSASQTLDAKEIELSGLEKQIDDDKNLPQDVEDAHAEASEIADVFYALLQQHEAMTEVQGQFDFDDKREGQEIKNSDLSISEMQVASLKRFTEENRIKLSQAQIIVDGMNEIDTSKLDTAIDVNDYEMSFKFTATKKDLIAFIQNLQTNPDRSLVIKTLKIEDMGENKDDTELSGQMSLDFMMLPQLKSIEEIQAAAETKTEKAVATEE